MTPVITWHTMDDTISHRYPTITIGDLVWETHHCVSFGDDSGEYGKCYTDQIDGHIPAIGRSLDVWMADSPSTDDLRRDYPNISDQARLAWDLGAVLLAGLWPHPDDKHPNDVGVSSLIIPGEHLTEDLLLEAFRRYSITLAKENA